MVKALGSLGDRLLSLLVPKADASACRCWSLPCPNGGARECCKIGGTLWCDTCE